MPDSGRKGIAIGVVDLFCDCCFLVSSSAIWFISLIAIFLFLPNICEEYSQRPVVVLKDCTCADSNTSTIHSGSLNQTLPASKESQGWCKRQRNPTHQFTGTAPNRTIRNHRSFHHKSWSTIETRHVLAVNPRYTSNFTTTGTYHMDISRRIPIIQYDTIIHLSYICLFWWILLNHPLGVESSIKT